MPIFMTLCKNMLVLPMHQLLSFLSYKHYVNIQQIVKFLLFLHQLWNPIRKIISWLRNSTLSARHFCCSTPGRSWSLLPASASAMATMPPNRAAAHVMPLGISCAGRWVTITKTLTLAIYLANTYPLPIILSR